MLILRERLIKWDVCISLLIVASAFEIPYALLVGYSTPALANRIEIFFSIFFIADIMISASVIHIAKFSGLFGWRTIAGLINKNLSPLANKKRMGNRRVVIKKQPAIAISYLRSGWFIVDILSAIPWFIVAQQFSGLRALRILRIVRVTKIVPGLKALGGFSALCNKYPTVRRLLVMLVVMPWIGHVLTCALYFVEKGNASEIHQYSDALYSIFLLLVNGDTGISETLTTPGKAIVISGLLLSLAFIGTAFANLTGMFTRLDNISKVADTESLIHHTLILGWSDLGASIIDQLSASSQYEKSPIVIIADIPKEEIWRDITSKYGKNSNREIIVVRGDYSSRASLEKASIEDAGKIIILEEPETKLANISVRQNILLKCLLTCNQIIEAEKSSSSSPDEIPSIPILVAVNSNKTKSVLENAISHNLNIKLSVVILESTTLASRLLAQITLEPDLALLYKDLFSYETTRYDEGSEIYCVSPLENQIGLSFNDIRLGYNCAVAIGYCHGEKASINPDRNGDGLRLIKASDTIVLITDSEDSFSWAAPPSSCSLSSKVVNESCRPSINSLVLGNGRRASELINQLGKFSLAGDSITACIDRPETNWGHGITFNRLHRTTEEGQLEAEETLSDFLDGCDLETVNNLIVIPSSTDASVHDAEAISALSMINGIRSNSQKELKIIVNLMENKSSELAKTVCLCQPVSHTELVANYITQVADDIQRHLIFHAIMENQDGAEFYLREKNDFCNNGESHSFKEILISYMAVDETAIGYTTANGEYFTSIKDMDEMIDCSGIAKIIVLANN